MNIQKIKSKVLTYEEYGSIKHDYPYILHLKTKSKELYFLGTRHTANPEDPIIDLVRKEFTEFSPGYVFVEQPIRGDYKNNKEVRDYYVGLSDSDLISSRGESGFLAKLSITNGVDVECPEPSKIQMINFLLDLGFTKIDVFTWFVTRALYQHKLIANAPSYEIYSESNRLEFKELTDWTGFDYSYESVINHFKSLTGAKDIEIESSKVVKEYISPGNSNSIRKIASKVSHLRDLVMVEKIVLALEANDRIFIVYGGSHAVVQEPALRYLFEEVL